MFGKYLVVWLVVGLLMGAGATTVLHADVSGVFLGGAADFAVLSTYDAVVIAKGYVYGDAGVLPGAEFWINDASVVTGTVYVPSTGAFHKSQDATVGNMVVRDLTDVVLDAVNAAHAFAAETGTDLGNITSATTISGSSGMNLFEIGNILLTGGDAITISGPANSWFVFNVAGDFHLDGWSTHIVAEQVPSSHILFNWPGFALVRVSGLYQIAWALGTEISQQFWRSGKAGRGRTDGKQGQPAPRGRQGIFLLPSRA